MKSPEEIRERIKELDMELIKIDESKGVGMIRHYKPENVVGYMILRSQINELQLVLNKTK